MRFYRVSIEEARDGHQGFQWFTSRRAAERCKRQTDYESKADPNELYDEDYSVTCTIEVVDVEPNKAGILRALNEYAGHPDNG